MNNISNILQQQFPLLSRFLSGRFSSGILWNFIATVFSQGSVFLTAIFLARILGKETFGEFGMIQSTLLTLAGLAQIATGLTATKYVAEFRLIDKKRAGRVLGLCSIMTVISGFVATVLLIFSASFLAEKIFKAPYLEDGLLIASAFVLFSVMNGFQTGALVGLERFKSLSVYGALLGIGYFIICVTGASFWGLYGAFAGMVISAMLRWLVYGMLLRREAEKQNITILYKEGFREKEVLYRFALPSAVSSMTTMPSVWLGNAFLVQQVNGFSEMGLYSAGINLRTIVLFLPYVINNVSLAIINSHKGSQNISSYSSSFFMTLKLTFFLALTGALVMWLSGEWVLQLFGKDFVGKYVTIMITLMSISVFFEALNIAVHQLIQSHEKMWLSFFAIALPRDLTVVILAYFLTAHYGAAGLAGAYVAGYFLALVVTAGLVYKMNLYNRM